MRKESLTMKTKRMITAVLTTAMALSAVPVMAETVTEDSVVYSYTDENGTQVDVTQAELDNEHWNKEALGDVAPLIYENFPMKMTGFANDFGELSLEFDYLKNIADMDKVNLKIKNIDTSQIIYNEDIALASFYSPIIDENDRYEVTLTETVDGSSSEYVRVVLPEKSSENLPDYVMNPTKDDEQIILVADVETLRNGIKTDDNGGIFIDRSVAAYDQVEAREFNIYCESLPADKIYRIYTNDGEIQYSGYLSTNTDDFEVYDLSIKAYTWDELNSPVVYSAPTNVTFDVVEANATELRLTDASFYLKESPNSRKYAAYEISVPNSALKDGSESIFSWKVTGQYPITVQVWEDTESGTTVRNGGSSANNENSITKWINTEDYTGETYVSFYVLIYFQSNVNGYAMISFSAGSAFGDEKTGSVYKAYTDMAETTDPATEYLNTEYVLNTSWDVDAFAFPPTTLDAETYRITIKNRSISDQTQLENGIGGISGSSQKYISFWSVTGASTFARWSETAVYTIPENADLTLYNEITDTGDDVFTIHGKEGSGSTAQSEYQLEYKRLG